MQLIILSAGKGSRLPVKFRKRPKCLVELNYKPLLQYNENFFKRFKNKIIVAGYKQKYLDKFTKNNGFLKIINKEYSSTNMVYSLFLTKKKINQDVVIIYGDIIFNQNIFNMLKPKKNILPVNINWLKNWKNRMSMQNILNDAENLFIKNNYLSEIGTKIDKQKIPKYQFMGIIKLRKKAFLMCYNFFKKLNDQKIDMTSFLNLCIKNKIISLKTEIYKDYWFEVDTIYDQKFAEREIKKW
ncbi:NTP transferase domain-containing protein [Candidatus Pelagibacter sp.]|nr:NTP transferase domain-containing protein [Candidatus Pelagibacter sp.]